MNTFLKKGAPALALLGLALSSCQPDLDAPKADANGLNFERYIAVGNSLTAGFGDNGLYREGQLNSYPNILAQQFAQAQSGITFNQPLFPEAQANGSGFLQLRVVNGALAPVFQPGNGGRGTNTAAAPYVKVLTPINNLGVPGIRMADIDVAGYGSLQGNAYFERITPDNTPTQTYRQRVVASNPTFFTFWLGNNDVLGYATAGGAVATSPITSTADFTSRANGILDDLTANGTKGLVATIPDVTNVPFFTTVGPGLRAGLTAAGVPSVVYTTGIFAPGQPNTRVTQQVSDIRDASGNGRQLFTLTFQAYAPLVGLPGGKVWRDLYRQTGQPQVGFPLFLAALQIDTTSRFGVSTQNPIPSVFVLDNTEQTTVRTATTAFNTVLTTKANAKNLAIFDANAFFGQVAQTGIATNATPNTAAFVSGNLFSLDGVHPTPRGYAVIANEMIRAINQKYGSTIQYVDASNYRGVLIP